MNTRLFNTGFRKFCNPAFLLAAAVMAFAAPSMAATVAFGLVCNSHNNSASCATGEQPLRVTLEQCTYGTANFTLHKIGARASFIGQRYFEDPKGLLRSIAALSAGSHGRNPFPGHGINYGTGDDAVKFLSGTGTGYLRRAIAGGELHLHRHPGGFNNGFGDSFIADAPAAVPVPETVWLFASGLFGFVGIARRRRETPAAPLFASH